MASTNEDGQEDNRTSHKRISMWPQDEEHDAQHRDVIASRLSIGRPGTELWRGVGERLTSPQGRESNH